MIGTIFSRLDALRRLQSSAEIAYHPPSHKFLDSVTQRTDRSTQAPVSVTQRTDSSTQTSVSVPQLPDSALSPITDSVRTEKGLGKL